MYIKQKINARKLREAFSYRKHTLTAIYNRMKDSEEKSIHMETIHLDTPISGMQGFPALLKRLSP